MFKVASLLGALLAAGLALGGCESTPQGHHHDTAMMSDKAITCSKCKVTMVQVKETNDKGRVVAYSTKPEMVCPDCKNAAESFFSTGKFQHTCATCGDTMEMCTTH